MVNGSPNDNFIEVYKCDVNFDFWRIHDHIYSMVTLIQTQDEKKILSKEM